jgi:predicted MFS family arabinose efflux permease
MRAYAPIFRKPHIPSALFGVFVGRLGYGANGLALLLAARQLAGSFAAGGTALALFLLGAGLMAPARGRLVDRNGGTRVLLALVAAHAMALCALAGLVALDGPTPALYVLCAASGLTVPPLVASLRNVLAATFAQGPQRDTAYVLDAILEQTSFVVGPLIAGAIVALASPQAAVAATAVAVLGGTLVFASSPPARAWRPHAAAATRRVALASPGLRVVALSFAAFGFASGTIYVAVPASATLAGSRDVAGLLLALLSAGSVAGGIVYGARAWRSTIGQRYVVVLWLFAGAMLALAGASSLDALGGLLLLTGCALAPVTALVFGLVDAVAPAGMATESFTWITSAELLGLSAGSAVAGAIVDGPGAHAAFATAGGVALAGALVAWVRRGALRSAVAEAPAR